MAGATGAGRGTGASEATYGVAAGLAAATTGSALAAAGSLPTEDGATGTAAGALMPLVAGRLFDGFGLGGVFGLAAAMYLIFIISVQCVPETYGRSPDAEPLAGTPATPQS